jgi:tetraacyldisaccharide 4'-kinase
MSWGNPSDSLEKLGQVALAPIAFFYQLGTNVRGLFYQIGFLKRVKLPAKVISVGNITVGGTGKTPVVIDLAKRFTDAGYKVAVLSRGYKRKSKEAYVVVSDGNGNFASCEESGDEPFLIAKSVPKSVVIVGSKRVETGRIACEKYGCNLILLDDGFQHWALARDLDIVLIDYYDNPENDALLPAGRLREGLDALRRAQYVVVTKVPSDADEGKLADLKSQIINHAPEAKLSHCSFVYKSLTKIDDSLEHNLDELKEKPVLAFSGIARPQSFITSLEGLGITVVAEVDFPDHHWFSADDMKAVVEEMKDSSAVLAVTTAKDAVRISPELHPDMPVYVLNLATSWEGDFPNPENLP